MPRNDYVNTNGEINLDKVFDNIDDKTKHVTKDGILQKGLNVEKINGRRHFTEDTDPVSLGYIVEDKDVWFCSVTNNEVTYVRRSGAWVGMGAVYK